MKRLMPILLGSILMLTGCVNYANVEQARIGMTVDQLLAIDTPCYYRGESNGKTTYNCKFSVPAGSYSSARAVKPYIMTFEDGKLTDMTLNQKEIQRQMMRDRIYLERRLYRPYRYPYHH